MSISMPQGNEVAERPPLPTRETIGDGVMLKASEAIWLKKEDKYRLFLAVEECIAQGHTADQIFAAIGITRHLYYDRIWLTEEQAVKFAATLAKEPVQTPEISTNGAEHVPATRKKKLSAQQKIDKLAEVSRLRYVEEMDFDEACRIMRITRQRFYDWSAIRSELIDQAKREKARAQRGEDRRLGKNSTHASRCALKEEVDYETAEQRKELVHAVQTLVIHGEDFLSAVKKTGIRARQYHQWILDAEREEREKERPLDLWNRCHAEPENREVRERFIMHFMSAAKNMAKKYADAVRLRRSFDVDEGDLVSAALYEGIAGHIDVFDPSRGVQVSTYFYTQMAQRMLDELRRQDWVPRLERQQETARYHLEQEFYQATNRFPSEEELAVYAEGQSYVHGKVPIQVSADAIHEDIHESKGARGWTTYDFLHDGNGQDREFNRIADMADQVLGHVYGIERTVLEGYYFGGKTMKEVGESTGYSESRISQIHTRATKTLQQILANDPDMPPMRHD